MTLPDTTGIYENLSREDYDAIDRMHWSTAKQFSRSPQHVLEMLRSKQQDKDAFRFGRCEHLAVLEPDEFEKQVRVWRGGDRRTKEGKAAWADFEAASVGKEILDDEEHRKCVLMARAIRGNPLAAKYVTGGKAEVTVLWDHHAFDGTVIQCKARLDYVGRALVDLKSARSASPRGFSKACWDYCYHGQSSMYRDGWIAAGGEPLPFVLLPVEKEPPFANQPYIIPPGVLERGRATYHAFMNQLATCQRTGSWPGYGARELELELPAWTYNLEDGAAL